MVSTETGHAVGICVIMAGGRGTRFWPLSRMERPKQLLPLAGERSLLRDTCDRVVSLVGPERVLVITAAGLVEAVRSELPELPPTNIVGEPRGCNTAPCAVLGMGLAARLDPTAPVALLPADHHIPDSDIFVRQLGRSFARAADRRTVVTLGIRPDRPETGYGYIQVAATADGEGFHRGEAFVEKPDLATAEQYVAGGRHYWNGGIFVWNPGWFADMASRHLVDVSARMAAPIASFGTESFAVALEEAYASCPAESIDYAVMEKLSEFEVLPAAFGWTDLGSWDAWGALAPALVAGNRGTGDVLAVAAKDNIVLVQDKLVALVGVEDLVIVDTTDALLVCRRADAQKIKDVITRLEGDGRRDLL